MSCPEIDETEIIVLMAREIVEDLCDSVSVEGRPKCLQILYRILMRREGVERLFCIRSGTKAGEVLELGRSRVPRQCRGRPETSIGL